jgi:hypothetical protein
MTATHLGKAGPYLMEIALIISREAYKKEIRIFRDRSSPNSHKEYTLTITDHGEEEKFRVQLDEVNPLFDVISKARICPYPAFRVPILDGTSYQLVFGEAWQRYTYWVPREGRPGFDDLTDIKDMMIAFADQCRRKAREARPEPKASKLISGIFK